MIGATYGRPGNSKSFNISMLSFRLSISTNEETSSPMREKQETTNGPEAQKPTTELEMSQNEAGK